MIDESVEGETLNQPSGPEPVIDGTSSWNKLHLLDMIRISDCYTTSPRQYGHGGYILYIPEPLPIWDQKSFFQRVSSESKPDVQGVASEPKQIVNGASSVTECEKRTVCVEGTSATLPSKQSDYGYPFSGLYACNNGSPGLSVFTESKPVVQSVSSESNPSVAGGEE